jgi:hypothetical protein
LRSERHPACRTVEKPHTEIVFERFDLKRDRRLSEKQFFCRFAKVQMLRGCAKHFKAKVFQLGHAMIIYGNRSDRVPVIYIDTRTTSRLAAD